VVIWITGISGAGKSTLCNEIYRQLKPGVPELVLLDGDVVRAAFGNDLGYREADRKVQIKRIQNIAKMLSDQGLVVLVAALYAHPELLAWNRRHIGDYFEVYLKASLDTVRRRDPKGLYAAAAAGTMPHVVGVDIPWHAPDSPDMVVDMNQPDSIETIAARVLDGVGHVLKEPALT